MTTVFAQRSRKCPVFMILALLVMPACGAEEVVDPEVHKLAFLRSVRPAGPSSETAFFLELAKHGFVVGDNLEIIGGSGDEVYPDPEEAAAAVRGWRDAGVDLIMAFSTTGAEIVREQAPETNALFLVNDPTAVGLVADEREPEANLTGVTFRVPADRTLALVQRILPESARIGLAYPPDDPAALPSRDAFVEAAQSLGLEILLEEFSDSGDVQRAVDALGDRGVHVLLLSVSPTATRALPEFAGAASSRNLPFVSNIANDQALMTLSPDLEAVGQQHGRQAVRLLNGGSPAEVPVEDPRRFLLTINRAAAARLGIEIPGEVLREADLVHN